MARKTDASVMEAAVAMWLAGESQAEAAAAHKLAACTLRRELRRRGLSRPRNHWGENHPRWKGGRRTRNGYVLLWVDPSDELAVATAGARRQVPEHRLVMARHLGRPIRADETVHHVNGDRADNRIENLQLHQGQHGPGVVMMCGSCGSIDIVPRDQLTETREERND